MLPSALGSSSRPCSADSSARPSNRLSSDRAILTLVMRRRTFRLPQWTHLTFALSIRETHEDVEVLPQLRQTKSYVGICYSTQSALRAKEDCATAGKIAANYRRVQYTHVHRSGFQIDSRRAADRDLRPIRGRQGHGHAAHEGARPEIPFCHHGHDTPAPAERGGGQGLPLYLGGEIRKDDRSGRVHGARTGIRRLQGGSEGAGAKGTGERARRGHAPGCAGGGDHTPAGAGSALDLHHDGKRERAYQPIAGTQHRDADALASASRRRGRN
jgi:hypothetical protein